MHFNCHLHDEDDGDVGQRGDSPEFDNQKNENYKLTHVQVQKTHRQAWRE
jgi:hypothetical protein